MTRPSINSPTAPVSGGLREQGNTKGSLSEVSKRSGNFANGAGCLSGSTAPRQLKALVACEYSGRTREIDVVEVLGFPGYVVSCDGHVYGCRTNFGFRETYRRLSPSADAKGYLGLTLCGDGGERRKVRIHRIVAETLIPNPGRLPCVRHLDGDNKNNSVTNLAWGTYADNEKDKLRHGTYNLRRNGKLSKRQRDFARQKSLDGVSQEKIAKMLSVSRPTITRLLNGSTWGSDNE